MTKETRTGGRAATGGVVPGRFGISVGSPSSTPHPGFRWTLLTDVARLESGHTPSRSIEEYWSGDIPWVGIRDATGNHGKTLYETEQHVSQAGLDNSSSRLLPAGTVCLSRTASVGYVITMGVPMATSQDFVNWVCGPDLNPRYLHYILVGEQESIRRFAHGTTHQTMYYPEAKALHALLPTRYAQDAIAAVLGALDDKIVANSHVVETLTAHMDASLEGAIRRVARPMQVADVAEFHNRHRVPLSANVRATRRGTVPYYGATGVFDYVDEPLFDRPLVLVGEDGSVVQLSGQPVVQYIWGPSWVNNHAHVLTGLTISTELLHAVLLRSNVASLVTGAVQPKLSMGNLKSMCVNLPGGSEMPLLEVLFAADSALLRTKTEESRSLSATRDLLLPLFMSGKVTVKDAERVTEEVL